MLRFGLILATLAAVLGLIADYPIDSPRVLSMPLLIVSGLMWSVATFCILMASGARGSRADEPPGYIAP